MASFNGELKLLNKYGDLNKALIEPENDTQPISHVRWNPATIKFKQVDQHLVTAVSSDGLIQNFLPIGKDEGPYSVIDTHQVEKNPIKAADYSCDGQNFTVAADDKNVYAYDIETGQQKLAMAKNRHVPNHSNIISCLRHHPTDPNLFVTGAWDSSIKLFDLRSKGPLSSLMTKGPICGDSVDLFDDMIVAGSYSSSKNCM